MESFELSYTDWSWNFPKSARTFQHESFQLKKKLSTSFGSLQRLDFSNSPFQLYSRAMKTVGFFFWKLTFFIRESECENDHEEAFVSKIIFWWFFLLEKSWTKQSLWENLNQFNQSDSRPKLSFRSLIKTHLPFSPIQVHSRSDRLDIRHEAQKPNWAKITPDFIFHLNLSWRAFSLDGWKPEELMLLSRSRKRYFWTILYR